MTATSSTGFVSKAPKLGFVPAFDGIRGVGIAMVLYEHALSDSSIGFFSFSPIVDVFFVLSGFLIVTLLLQEHRSTGNIDLRKFYTRRGLRLLPSVWLYLVVMLLLAAVFLRDYFDEVLKDAAAAFFYVYNLFAPPGTAMVDPAKAANRAMSQLWTLSLEEQFYFLIAGTILICIAKRWIKPLVAVCVVTALVIQFFRARLEFGPFMIVMQRPDALLLGVTLAAVNAAWGEFSDIARRRLRWIASGALLIGIAVMCSSSTLVRSILGDWAYAEPAPLFWKSWVDSDGVKHCADAALYVGDAARCSGTDGVVDLPGNNSAIFFVQYGHTLVIWMTLPVVLAFVRVREWRVSTFLTWKPFMWMGRLSYALYVWHGLGIILALAIIPNAEGNLPKEVVRALVAWTISFAVAIPVYKYVELRFQKVKLSFASEQRVVDVATGKEVDVDVKKRKGSE